jgi:hypothetical protein
LCNFEKEKQIAMDVIIKVKSDKDHKLITDLAKRLGLPNKTLSLKEKEDMGLLLAMEEGIKSGIASDAKVMSKLKKNASGK